MFESFSFEDLFPFVLLQELIEILGDADRFLSRYYPHIDLLFLI